MKIDVHAHYRTNDYLDRIAALGKTDIDTQRGLGAGAGQELDARLRLTDRAGVDMQILSPCPQMPYGDDREQAVAAARFVNDQYAAVVASHPNRFMAFASTPMPHIDESIAELGRALDELHLAGQAMNTTAGDHAPVEPRFEPILAELDRRGAVLYLHPAGNSACTPLIADGYA